MKTKKIMTDMEVDKKVRLIYTQFDRKRKLTDRQVETCKRNLQKGKRTVAELAKKYKVSEFVIKYNTDPEFRKAAINARSGKHYGITTADFDNRVAYKRKLMKNRTYLKLVGVKA